MTGHHYRGLSLLKSVQLALRAGIAANGLHVSLNGDILRFKLGLMLLPSLPLFGPGMLAVDRHADTTDSKFNHIVLGSLWLGAHQIWSSNSFKDSNELGTLSSTDLFGDRRFSTFLVNCPNVFAFLLINDLKNNIRLLRRGRNSRERSPGVSILLPHLAAEVHLALEDCPVAEEAR